jgi:hypothetical protein
MTRHFVRLFSFAIASALIAGCAPTITVSSHVDRTVDFSRYHSYDWGPADALPTGDPRLDQNPFFKDHVQGAVERQLAAKGLRLTMSDAPDLLIHYHANIARRFDVNRADRTYGYCRTGDCPTDIVEYEAGTLVIDIMDARTNTLLWRGWAQNSVADMLRDDDAMARTIERAVSQMLARFPRQL